MTNQDGKFPKARRSDADTDTASPGRAPRESSNRENSVTRSETEVELHLAELVGDANGEIVFLNDSGFRTLGLCTDVPVVAEGRSEARVTAGGADVSGFKYVTFDNGLTLYYDDVDLIIRRPTGSERR